MHHQLVFFRFSLASVSGFVPVTLKIEGICFFFSHIVLL